MIPKIKFGTCPIEKHKGEIWPKLQNRDLTKLATLVNFKYMWDNEVPLADIRKDTFPDFTLDDFRDLMQKFYGGPVFGILLEFNHPNGPFTTFRAYDWKKSNWYSNSLGKNFQIVVAGLNDGKSIGRTRPRQRKWSRQKKITEAKE
jgi:hypothetical protein